MVASAVFPGASVVLRPQAPEQLRLPRLAVGGGIFLEVAQVRLDGRPTRLPLDLVPGVAHDVEVLVVPAYRVTVDGPDAFGRGFYRQGAVARIGVGDTRIASDGVLGLLAGTSRFDGWDGVAGDESTLDLVITGPVVARARFRADPVRPAAIMGLVALLLLAHRPGPAPWWDGVDLGRKAL